MVDQYEACCNFIRENKPKSNATWVLVGNKIDLPFDYRKIKRDDLENMGKELDICVGEVSCSKRNDVKRLFKDVIFKDTQKRFKIKQLQ